MNNSYSINEAEDKWCPFALANKYKYGSYNRSSYGSKLDECLCIHKKCMAWNWIDNNQRKGYCSLCKNEFKNESKVY